MLVLSACLVERDIIVTIPSGFYTVQYGKLDKTPLSNIHRKTHGFVYPLANYHLDVLITVPRQFSEWYLIVIRTCDYSLVFLYFNLLY